ncbi:class I SAM-dependent methyltransferase [Allorhodopirellula solitaria]|uniref:Demethylrebeccamycin-D-glucose O-methyltransferase n=1 Tax=Allorhodopirellula solitaria TaxID=2527987 RepID=A0A5C5X0D0_9BACT|nr:class I SAM-dependent methyltransferase [Allorhodopirellula solitaria]TWT56270.1 Demethylrebeccamycin-D-glucose O-methyltransferase [Allorhodopirellula solitaria]
MIESLPLLRVALGQLLMPQTLARTPEPQIMDSATGVAQYNQALQSKLSIVYAGALLKIHQMRRTKGGRALDLCCGPGHFTLQLAKYFDFDEVIGLDLSGTMIEAANTNAEEWGLADRVRFIHADATSVPFDDASFALVSCNDAAHHLPNLEIVGRLLTEMGRLCSKDGVTLLTDLVRMKNAQVTNWYTDAIGRDYTDKGLHEFQQDFCNSMQAAWLPSELSHVMPNRSDRTWEQIVQRIIPTVQFLASYPTDGSPRQVRGDAPWRIDQPPVPQTLQSQWRLFSRLV